MRLCLIIINCLIAQILFSQETPKTLSPAPESPYVEREEKQFNFYPGGKIEILTGVPGSLKIVGWNKGSIRVEAEKIIYYETAEKAKAFLQKSPLRIRHNETSVTVRAIAAPELPAILEVNYTIYVPSEKTDIRTSVEKGDFSIEGINGWVEVTSKEGSLEAKSMAGYFSGNTLRGEIFVEMSGKRWNGLEFAAVTHQGSANVRLPEKYDAALQLETRNGKIIVDYPNQVVEGEVVPPEIMIRKTSQSLKASVGDGGAPLKIVTYSGDISLSLKEK
jgi:DUF4097 and DUF4098 domain-containing protein YvlB